MSITPDADSATPALSRPRVLLVDDQPDILELVSLLLDSEGFSVATASGGEAALEAARHGRFHAFVLDVSMPRMDGIELAMALRSEPLALDVPIFFHTSLMESEVRARFTDYAGFFRKPVEPGRMTRLLSEQLRLRTTSTH